MPHHEVDHAGKKPRILHGLAELTRIDTRQRKETPKHIRLVRQPAENCDSCLFRVACVGRNVFWVMSHYRELVTSFSTKWPYRRRSDKVESACARTYMLKACLQGRIGEEHMPKRVMIVEDNELNMKLFRDLIEACGYETIQTRNGMEAMDLARKHRPDLILMDIQLPEVSGLEVTKWLKEDDELHVIPVIAVTAFAMKGDEERIRQGGCEAYVSKPISVPKFIETIKTYLGDA